FLVFDSPPKETTSMSPPTIAPSLAGNALGSAATNFVIAEWRDPGGPPEPRRLIAPRHVHHSDDEAWYVLEGVLRVQLREREVELRAGSGILVPRGTPHTYWNPSASPTRYLLTMTGNIFQLIQDIHALKERTPAALQEVFRQHDSEVL